MTPHPPAGSAAPQEEMPEETTTELMKWAADRIPNGPACGWLKGLINYYSTQRLAEAIDLIVERRLRVHAERLQRERDAARIEIQRWEKEYGMWAAMKIREGNKYERNSDTEDGRCN